MIESTEDEAVAVAVLIKDQQEEVQDGRVSDSRKG